ncbi:hypothetical protein N7462_005465 [Penicillium macrosclerotiorum]|uniref:uncharacterized protein n=1 Tax=Penicillium macrosclerotiorum TaxID=303699 RepID=UPI002547FEE3|nr:uncharacterized protein N7462_005465 [Penicillium macrosclerotiorum]KAJ5682300.1 hypothetical protein N7462_005465 [Penicillium macrosclerotiorum]
MLLPAIGTPMGLEIPVKDTKRASIFYEKVFNWKFSAESHVGAPEEYLLVFKVDGEMFPGGGIIKKVPDAELAVTGATKVFLYVDDIESAIEKIETNGGKMLGEKEAEGDQAFYQYFQDSEGNAHAIYTFNK